MIVCPKCGEINADDSVNCFNCGADLTPLIRLRERYKLYYNKGLELAKNGKFHEAIQSLIMSASLNPRQEQSYIVLGKLFAQRGDYESAKHYWIRAQEIAPNNEKPSLYLNKINRILEKKKRFLPILSIRKFIITTFIIIMVLASTILIGEIIERNKMQRHIERVLKQEYPTTKRLLFALVNEIAPKYRNTSIKFLNDNIQNDFENAFRADSQLATEQITFTQEDGVIKLNGTASSMTQKKRVEQLAKNTLGVMFVDSTDLSTPNEYLYVIREGDSGSKLAKIFYKDSRLFKKLKQANPMTLADDYKWLVGSVIVIPNYTPDNPGIPK